MGEGELATGWTEERDGVRGFMVTRGWVDMRSFERALEREELKEAVQIVRGWGREVDLVSFRAECNGLS